MNNYITHVGPSYKLRSSSSRNRRTVATIDAERLTAVVVTADGRRVNVAPYTLPGESPIKILSGHVVRMLRKEYPRARLITPMVSLLINL